MVLPYGCTMDFIFQQNGVYAIGTAGHCTDNVGQHVVILTIAPGTPPSANNLVLVDIGTVVSRTMPPCKTDALGLELCQIGPDFALVSIRPELQSWVFPTIAVVGGPCGAYTGSGLASVPMPFKGMHPLQPESLFHYGHGLAIGTGGTPRAGVATAWEADLYYWAGTTVFGDSGSPVRVGSLPAAGNLTDLVIDTAHPGATTEGTRITKIAQLASPYALASSPYCP